MLLRLRVKNFKNLKDVDIRFGPVTCFVGPNGVGKSNIFDALQFLRALADSDIQTAAQSVRSPAQGSFGPRELFWAGNPSNPMYFEADLLVPKMVLDDFGREAKPATTLLRYELKLHYRDRPTPRLELARETLTSLKFGEAKEVLGFPHSHIFRRSAVTPTRRVGPLISTKEEGGLVKLMLHQDGGSRGQPIPAGHSPRTVLGGTNAAEYPTVLAARREMASWQLLHLEPSVMRTPDNLGGPDHVDARGGHIASTLDRLVRSEVRKGQTLAEAANRLAELVPELQSLALDRDDVRQQLSVMASMRGADQPMGPRALSDGTLRFLALVTLLLDRESCEVLCMEEPENGMHPTRMRAMVDLIRDFAVDPQLEAGSDNPLRQAIVNTHSPDVIRQLDASEVLFVDAIDGPDGSRAQVSAVRGKWRTEGAQAPFQRLCDFIGGAPLGASYADLQQEMQLGTAR